jgi:hypothetical protein
MNCPAKNLIAVLVLLASLTPHNADAHGRFVEAAAPEHATHIASPDHQFVADFMIDAGTTGALSVSVAKDFVVLYGCRNTRILWSFRLRVLALRPR